MKQRQLIRSLLMTGALIFAVGPIFAQEMEIDLGDQTKPAEQQAAPTLTPVPQAVPPTPVAQQAQPAAKEESSQEVDQTEEEKPETATREIHGVLKAKDYYEAGIKHYKKKEYDVAIKYLKQAVEKKDPYTPKYIYAEANAMLGVIYEFRIIHYKAAYYYYSQALKYERNNPTAMRHIKEVKKKLKKKVWE